MNILTQGVKKAIGSRQILLGLALVVSMLVMRHGVYGQEMREDSGVIDNFSEKLAEWLPVSTSSSAGVETRIAKLAGTDRNRVKAAARAGAKFMQQYLDEFACMTDYPEWDDQIAAFVEDREKITQICGNIKPTELSRLGGKYHGLLELCSNPSLVDFSLADGAVSLTYQVAILGTTEYGNLADQDQIAFDPENSGAMEKIVVVIGADNKVFSFSPADWKYERMYLKTLGEVDVDKQSPYVIPANADTAWRERIERYRKLAKQLKKQIARICR